MRSILLGLALGMAATAAAAQDAPPPGCRWQSYQGDQILACKDGKGYWRRSGDDQVVGTYPIAKPKPKPVAAKAVTPAPKTAASTATSAAASTAATGAPVVAELAPPAPPPPPDEAAIAAADAAAAAEASTTAAPAVEPAKPAPAAKTPWWKGFLDRLWGQILGFLKLIGLLH